MLAFFFDWSGRSGRAVFLVVLVLFLCAAGAYLGPLAERLPQDAARRVGAFAFGLTFLAFHGVTVRRLHDAGRRGWWYWISIVPLLGPLALCALCLSPAREGYMPQRSGLRRLGVLAATCVAVALMLRVSWVPYWIPAGSMKPTLLPGDLLIVGFAEAEEFRRGDIVVFRHPDGERDYVKRLVGLPGDTVQMQAGRVWLNGTALPAEPAGMFVETFEPQGPAHMVPLCGNGVVGMGGRCEKSVIRETLNGHSYDTLDIRMGPLDNTALQVVPEGHAFVLGDNRDNSSDSRVPQTARGVGFVPVENLIGRAGRVVFSASGRWLWDIRTWRGDRMLMRIE